MKKYTYIAGLLIAAWLIWELVRLGGFNEALLPTPVPKCCSALGGIGMVIQGCWTVWCAFS